MKTDKRYQVFVSSTFVDLKKEREEVIQVLLEMDCMPSGMELFPATDDTQWDLIKQVIDDCDYYVLIIGGRYGSIGPGGLSYTEMEYRYAMDTGKPTIAFLHGNPGQIAAEKTEASEEGRKKLAEFRTLAEQKLCRRWESPADLGSSLTRSLNQLMKSKPGVGWVRASAVTSSEATAEILQLRKQIDDLNSQLLSARTSAPAGSSELAQGDDIFTFSLSFRAVDQYHTGQTVPWEFDASWNDIFARIAPLMIQEATDQTLASNLDNYAQECLIPELAEEPDFAGHTFARFSIANDDFQTVKVQLIALGLIKKVERAKSVKDTDQYWTLSPYGETVMTRLRAIRSAAKQTPKGHEPHTTETKT